MNIPSWVYNASLEIVDNYSGVVPTPHTVIASIIMKNYFRGLETTTPELTMREHTVLNELLEGKGNKQIAYSLGISEQGVKNCLNVIYSKLGTSSRLETVVKVVRAMVDSSIILG